MKRGNRFSALFIGGSILSILLFHGGRSGAEPLHPAENRTIEGGAGEETPSVADSNLEGEDQSKNEKILVELFLPADRKKDIDTIKKELQALSIKRIRPQFFKMGNPIENIAIGNNIPAPVARLAIQLAITYNRGIKYILPEFRYFPDHVVIGSSAFDESSQIPILPEDLQRLSDPSLSTLEFHRLYRSLTGEDEKLPTYID